MHHALQVLDAPGCIDSELHSFYMTLCSSICCQEGNQDATNLIGIHRLHVASFFNLECHCGKARWSDSFSAAERDVIFSDFLCVSDKQRRHSGLKTGGLWVLKVRKMGAHSTGLRV